MPKQATRMQQNSKQPKRFRNEVRISPCGPLSLAPRWELAVTFSACDYSDGDPAASNSTDRGIVLSTPEPVNPSWYL